jgi:hypothetical protein
MPRAIFVTNLRTLVATLASRRSNARGERKEPDGCVFPFQCDRSRDRGPLGQLKTTAPRNNCDVAPYRCSRLPTPRTVRPSSPKRAPSSDTSVTQHRVDRLQRRLVPIVSPSPTEMNSEAMSKAFPRLNPVAASVIGVARLSGTVVVVTLAPVAGVPLGRAVRRVSVDGSEVDTLPLESRAVAIALLVRYPFCKSVRVTV